MDLVWAIAWLLAISMVLVFAAWMFYSSSEGSSAADAGEGVEQCPYCTYVFLKGIRKDVIQCPRCKSFLTV